MARHVLVIEDDPDLSELLSDVLVAAGYEVTVSASGFGAAGLVRSLNPCAIVLDIGLPYRPGTSVLADLKTDPRTANVPVLVLSGMAEALSEERRAQASAVLTKPLDMSDLLETIGKVAA